MMEIVFYILGFVFCVLIAVAIVLAVYVADELDKEKRMNSDPMFDLREDER